MSGNGLRFWFLVYPSGGGIVEYIVSAYTYEQVERRFGILRDQYQVEILSWHSLSLKTGCQIPTGVDYDDQAFGDLCFCGSGSPFIITIA